MRQVIAPPPPPPLSKSPATVAGVTTSAQPGSSEIWRLPSRSWRSAHARSSAAFVVALQPARLTRTRASARYGKFMSRAVDGAREHTNR